MKRIHLFEIEDQSWCPKSIRNGVTDFLQHIVQTFYLYKPIAPLLTDALVRSHQVQVLDLCSGGTGPWLSLVKDLATSEQSIKITLTDLYPNQSAFQRTQSGFFSKINYITSPIDATQVPKDLLGFRTLFSSFHHLNPHQAQALLQNAVDHKAGIAIFESTQRHPLTVIYMLAVPLLVLIYTPFIQPFSWSRLFWTYIIPAIPLTVAFDGIVSCLRTYSVKELKEMTEKLTPNEYNWEIGLKRISFLPIGVTYLIGIPKHPVLCKQVA